MGQRIISWISKSMHQIKLSDRLMYEIVDVRISLRRRFGTDKVGITHAGRFYIYVTDYDKFKSNHSLSRK